MKMLSRPDGFMLYGKLLVELFSPSDLFHPNMKTGLRLIRVRPIFYMISDNPTLVLELLIVHFTIVLLHLRMIITRTEWTCLLTLLWLSTIWKLLQRLSAFLPDKTSSFEKNISNKGPVRRIAIAKNTNTALIGFFNENPFWYQQFSLRQIRVLKGGPPTVDFDAADNFRFYVTTMKAMNRQDDITSFPNDNFKTHYVLLFDLTPMQDANENCHYRELVGEPLRLELSFNFPLEHVIELIVLGERMSSVAVDKFGVVGEII